VLRGAALSRWIYVLCAQVQCRRRERDVLVPRKVAAPDGGQSWASGG